MEIADTHEHFMDEQQRVSRPIDFFDLLGHYTLGDAVSAGMPAEALRLMRNRDAPDVDRWRAVEPYWKFSRFTGYSRCLRTAIRDIYGFEEISQSTIRRINEAIRARNKLGLYRHILKDRARIRFYVQDDRAVNPTKADQEFFVIAREFEDFITPQEPADIQKLEQLTGVSITTLSGLKQALEKRFEQAVKAGMVAVKTLLAYQREIFFREVEEPDARRDFESLVQGDHKLPEGFRRRIDRPFRNLEDHMFHQVMKLADAHGIPVQIHTGLNNANFIANSNPVHLTNLFFLYPRTKFDLFHIGYPYLGELSALAKSFANVYIDFCWAHIISPTASRRALDEFLDTVPSNKILAFGGDFIYPELSYAHAKMARRNLAQVLARKVEDGFCNESEALELSRRLLHDNAARLFWPGGG
jgi:predicted TIM-barrel fold metal-dependent hydrolase